MLRPPRLALALLLLAALGFAGCAANEGTSDRDQPRAYGGVTGGMMRQ
jgi:hypothetical protein